LIRDFPLYKSRPTKVANVKGVVAHPPIKGPIIVFTLMDFGSIFWGGGPSPTYRLCRVGSPSSGVGSSAPILGGFISVQYGGSMEGVPISAAIS